MQQGWYVFVFFQIFDDEIVVQYGFVEFQIVCCYWIVVVFYLEDCFGGDLV